jgi:Flp pilus assembly protein TadD
VNNLLHALASVLLLAAAGRIGASSFAALSAALLFAVHPAHTEAVDAIVGRAEILACVLVLSALLLHASDRRSAAREFGLGFSYFLALLAKESAVFALPLFFLYDALLAKGVRWRSYLALLASLSLYLVLRWQILGGMGIAEREIGLLDNPAAHASAWVRFLTAPVLFAKYLLLLIAPANLSADYSFNQIPLPNSPVDFRVLGGVAAALGLALVFYYLLRGDRRLVAFSLAVTVIPLLGMIHLLFPLGTLFAERLVYLPSFGATLAAGLGMAALAKRQRLLGRALLGLLVVLGLLRTWDRNRDWVDNETLFRRTVESSPQSARSHFLLGTALFEKADFAGAIEAFSQGLLIAPGHREGGESLAESRRALATALYKDGRLEEALTVLRQVVEVEPRAEDMNQVGILQGALGRLDEAETWHRRVLERDSRNAVALNYLGVLEERRGRKEKAGALYREALSVSPELLPALLNLGSLRLNEGELVAAEKFFRRASELEPRSYEAFNSLGIALARLGRAEEAAAAFRRAITIDPALPAARDNLRLLERNDPR